TLNADELADCDQKIAAVEQFLDDWSGQHYSGSLPIIDEAYQPAQHEPLALPPVTAMQMDPFIVDPVSHLGQVQLKATPVGQITAVRQRPNGSSPLDDVGWTPADPSFPGSIASGLIKIPAYANYPNVFVTYTTLQGVPPIFTEIVTQIVAYMLPYGSTSGAGGIPQPAGPLTGYSLGGDISFSFASRMG